MDPSPSGDAAGEGGVCDIAVDNKVVEAVAMDTGGDNNAGHKDENDLMNGDRDESDNATNMKISEANIEDDGFAQFAPLTALDNDEDNEIDDGNNEEDGSDAQVNDTNADYEAGGFDNAENDVTDEQAPGGMSGGIDDTLDSIVEADFETTGHGEAVYRYLL